MLQSCSWVCFSVGVDTSPQTSGSHRFFATSSFATISRGALSSSETPSTPRTFVTCLNGDMKNGSKQTDDMRRRSPHATIVFPSDIGGICSGFRRTHFSRRRILLASATETRSPTPACTSSTVMPNADGKTFPPKG